MQGPSDCPVVPMGRMSMGNALNGHPRRRTGAKLQTKTNERKKPSLKSLLGVTPLDFLGKVTTESEPTPVKLLEKIIGTCGGYAPKAAKQTKVSLQQEQQKRAQEEQQNWQQEQVVQQAPAAVERCAAFVPHQPQPQDDTRTNLEKYMDIKMHRGRGHPQLHMNGTAPGYYNHQYDAVAQGHQEPMMMQPQMMNNTMMNATTTQQQAINTQIMASQMGFSSFPQESPGCWNEHIQARQHQTTEQNYQMHPNNFDMSCSRFASELTNREGSQSFIPQELLFETPPVWFQHKSYMPQVRSYSHMTAPVPGAPFHPGFSYATDFKYYYNYYSADEYAGEIDGGDAAAQLEAVAREQAHAEEIARRQVTQNENPSNIKPVLTSRKRLESGRAVVI